MTKRQRQKLERLAADPASLALFLGLELLPHEARDCVLLAGLAAAEGAGPVVEAGRWRIAEDLLWRAAHAEARRRAEAAPKGKRESATLGVGWKAEPMTALQFRAAAGAAALQREIDDCCARLADLRRAPALQAPPLRAFRDRLAAELRDRIAALQARQVEEAAALVDAARAEGVSRQASENRRNKSGHGDVTRPRYSPGDQDALARKLRARHPSDRLSAGTAWRAETALSDSAWRKCATRIGWPADSAGRPRKAPPGGRRKV